MKTIEEIQPANARTFGSVVRKTLKELGLDWKVKCKTVSFAGFGYGSTPFAEIQTARLMTYLECSRLADAVRALRSTPPAQGGGKGIISLAGKDYAFGGAIGRKDYPSGEAFWRQAGLDLNAVEMKNTPVIKEAERRALLAYRAEKPRCVTRAVWCKQWIQEAIDDPEAWAVGWPDIYTDYEAPVGWPGIMAFEGEVVKP